MESGTDFEAIVLEKILENIKKRESPKASLPKLKVPGNKLLWDDRRVFENQKLKTKMIEFKRRLKQGDIPVTLEDDELFETLDNDYPKKLSHSSTVSLAVPPLSNRL